MPSAAEYIREMSLQMRDGYIADCVKHARRVAELLEAEGRSPWIARIHEEFETPKGVYHGPLIPRRFPTLTWTTHYAACAGREVYDPILGEPIDVDAYSLALFGRVVAIDSLPWSSFALRLPSSSSPASR